MVIHWGYSQRLLPVCVHESCGAWQRSLKSNLPKQDIFTNSRLCQLPQNHYHYLTSLQNAWVYEGLLFDNLPMRRPYFSVVKYHFQPFACNTRKSRQRHPRNNQIATEPSSSAETPRNFSSKINLTLYLIDDSMQQQWLDGYGPNLASSSKFGRRNTKKETNFKADSSLLLAIPQR